MLPILQAETSEVVIVDFGEATVRCLLQYMYGCLPEMPRHHSEVGHPHPAMSAKHTNASVWS